MLTKRRRANSQKQNFEELSQEYVKFSAVVQTWLRKFKTTKRRLEMEGIKLADFYIEELNKYKQLLNVNGCMSMQIDDEIQRLLKDLMKITESAKFKYSKQQLSEKSQGQGQLNDMNTNCRYIPTSRFTDEQSLNTNNFTLSDIPMTNENFISQNNDTIDGNEGLYLIINGKGGEKISAGNNHLGECKELCKSIRTWITTVTLEETDNHEGIIRFAEIYTEQLTMYQQLSNGCKPSNVTNEINYLLKELSKITYQFTYCLKSINSQRGNPDLDVSSELSFPMINFTQLDRNPTEESGNIDSGIPLTNNNFVTQTTQDDQNQTILVNYDELGESTGHNRAEKNISNNSPANERDIDCENVEYRFLADFINNDKEISIPGGKTPLYNAETYVLPPSSHGSLSPIFEVPFTIFAEETENESDSNTVTIEEVPNDVDESSQQTMVEKCASPEMVEQLFSEDIFDNTESERFEQKFSIISEKLKDIWTRVQQEDDSFSENDLGTLDRGLDLVDEMTSKYIVLDLENQLEENACNLERVCTTEPKKRINPFKWTPDEKASMLRRQQKKTKPEVEINDATNSDKHMYFQSSGWTDYGTPIQQEPCNTKTMLSNWEDILADSINLVDD